MWSHYANNHKGAVLGFWAKSVFDGHMFSHLHEPQLNATHMWGFNGMFGGECLLLCTGNNLDIVSTSLSLTTLILQPKARTRILFEIFQQKSDEWIYEKEHRVTLRLDQADKIVVNDVSIE